MLWKEEGGEWTVSLVKQQKIPFDEQVRIPDWKIHEPAGGAAHAHKRLREIYTYSLKKSIYIYIRYCLPEGRSNFIKVIYIYTSLVAPMSLWIKPSRDCTGF